MESAIQDLENIDNVLVTGECCFNIDTWYQILRTKLFWSDKRLDFSGGGGGGWQKKKKKSFGVLGLGEKK